MPTYTKGLNVPAIAWALGALAQKAADYKRARDYYDGRHPLEFVTEKFRSAFADRLFGMKANLCPAFVDIPANRLIVSAQDFTVRLGAGSTREDLPGEITDVWELNRMDTRGFDTMREALKCGDSYLIVWPDKREDGTLDPIFYPQKAGTCAVKYHDERPGYVVQAAKFWKQGKKVRLTIYTATEIEKYISLGDTETLPTTPGAFKRFELDGEAWPLFNPYGKCPVFHFANGEERKSELSDIYDSQNALNLTLCNLLVAMEFFSYPQRYVLGFDPKNSDPTGQGLGEWKAAMDRIWFHFNEDTKMGQFDPSSPSAFLDVMREFRSIMNEIKGIPPHYFSMSGTVPSGVALEILERRLNDLIKRLKTAWGNVWADAMLLALKMKGAVSEGQSLRLGCGWEDTSPRDELAEITAQEAKQRAGVSRKQSLLELGYSLSRIEEMKDEKAEEQQSAGDLMGKMFNQGAV